LVIQIKDIVIFHGKMIRTLLVILLSSIYTGQRVEAADNTGTGDVKFDPGSFIFDHIGDAYDWHLFDINGRHYSVPLPVILYSREKGLNIFLSNRFNHGYDAYKGFRIESEGPRKGKIVHALEDGTTDPDASLPLDFSMTKNVIGMLFASFVMMAIFLSIGYRYKTRPISPPKGLQGLFEPLVIFVIEDIVKPAIGHKYERFLPYLLTLFFFIWINNMLGLIPIFPMGANVTGNISVTAGLALTSFLVINLSGNRRYWQHIFNTPNVPMFLKLPIPLMPLIEIVGMFTKPFVLMVRLFANITAGHIITMGFFSLIFIFAQVSFAFGYGATILSVAFGIFITFLELLVALIQAYVFTLLTSLFIGAAIDEGH
jgi:F-type H+-transporting ATPase subunit a